MKKYKKYALIYHFAQDSHELKFESAQCEGDTEIEIVVKLLKWFSKRIDCCEVHGCDCRNNPIMISSEISAEMRAVGAAGNMVEIK